MCETYITPKDYSRFPNPCYVVEEKLLRKNLSMIKEIADDSGAEIILALKAFSLWKTFSIFKEYIPQVTASSYNEARLAYEEFGCKVHTFSPAYEDNVFDDIVKYSQYITFNSFAQYRHFYNNIASNREISCGIRINPEYSEIETELYNPCAPGSRFGVIAKDLPCVLPPKLEGFHCHNHCESTAESFARSLQEVEKKFQKWFNQIYWLNLGGGHLMTKDKYNIELLKYVLKDFKRRYPHIKIILEPGSAFAWHTGPLISKVIDIVENRNIKTAILNVSFACHMPDCLEMPYHPAVRGATQITDIDLSLGTDNIYRLGGNSCLSGDYMGLWRFNNPLMVGDYIVFEDMIHYTTVKTNMFNGVSHPAIALLKENNTVDLLRMYTYEDYRARMD